MTHELAAKETTMKGEPNTNQDSDSVDRLVRASFAFDLLAIGVEYGRVSRRNPSYEGLCRFIEVRKQELKNEIRCLEAYGRWRQGNLKSAELADAAAGRRIALKRGITEPTE